jgi:multiple sugar transport system permease protein
VTNDQTERAAPFLLPALGILGIVALSPIAVLFWMSFRERLLPFNIDYFVGVSQYVTMLSTARFWNSLGVTLYFALLSVTLEMALGLMIALMLVRDFPGVKWARALILLPWAIPTVVTARLWEWMYQPDLGVLNFVLGQVGLGPVNWLASPLTAIHAAILADIWKMTPFAVILCLAGLAMIPKDLYQAASLDGATPWQSFRHVTFPLLRPTLVVIVLFRFIDALRVFDLPFVLTGGGPADATETLSIYTYKMYFQTFQFGYGSALGVVMFLLVATSSVIIAWVGRLDFHRLMASGR